MVQIKWKIQGKIFLQVWLGIRLLAMKSGTHVVLDPVLVSLSGRSSLMFYQHSKTPKRKHSFSSSSGKILRLTWTSWLAHTCTFNTKTWSLGYTISFECILVMVPIQGGSISPIQTTITNNNNNNNSKNNEFFYNIERKAGQVKMMIPITLQEESWG